jgi:hypothetical protein
MRHKYAYEKRHQNTDGQAEAARPQDAGAPPARHLNPNPEKVSDPLFATSAFFDARDLVQVKYEMVRRVRVDGEPVSHSAAAFGFSRPTLYQARAIERGGLAALVPTSPAAALTSSTPR